MIVSDIGSYFKNGFWFKVKAAADNKPEKY